MRVRPQLQVGSDASAPGTSRQGGGGGGGRPTGSHTNKLWLSHPRKYGPGSRHCRVTGNTHGLIRKYGINMSRRVFREYAKDIGFQKLD